MIQPKSSTTSTPMRTKMVLLSRRPYDGSNDDGFCHDFNDFGGKVTKTERKWVI